jgi:superfamily II DNA or RNA helicase
MIKLYEYQLKYLDKLPPRAIMAADTGTGKTFMALEHYKRLASGTPLLIVAPASKVRTKDWEREITEYFGEGNEPEYHIYSYEKFSREPSLEQFRKGKRAIWHQYAPQYGGRQWAVIADEVHKAKNPQSGAGQAMYYAAKDAKFFVGLSATPLPNGWIDFANYSKMFSFVRNITEFKKRYCNYVTYKGFPELINYWHEGEMAGQWQGMSRRLTKAQALDLPDRQFIGVDFTRPKEYLKTIISRQNLAGDILDNPSALAHALRQTLTKGKLDYLSDLIEGTDENIVIFYNYVTEHDAISEMISKKHSDRLVFRQNGQHHELPTKSEWATTKRTITLSHYKSGSTGVEMTYATQVIYFSPTYSYAEYIQSVGRVYRNGQTQKTTFYNFRTPNSIEEDIYQCLRGKNDFQASQWKEQL